MQVGSRTGPGGAYARSRECRRAKRCISMARNSGNRPVGGPELTVGVRVLVRRSAGADLTGEVVEDYAAVTDPGGGGHEWAPVHRWAVALDDGRLVFADTEDLTIDPGSYRSALNSSSDPDSAVRTPGRHRGE
ncbi:hypothetical protein OPAG_06647 [Rhodococcus opacus PD630]|nr:hypothetical protein OPAG_06647 [Rhodococcus opacus PD630]